MRNDASSSSDGRKSSCAWRPRSKFHLSARTSKLLNSALVPSSYRSETRGRHRSNKSRAARPRRSAVNVAAAAIGCSSSRSRAAKRDRLQRLNEADIASGRPRPTQETNGESTASVPQHPLRRLTLSPPVGTTASFVGGTEGGGLKDSPSPCIPAGANHCVAPQRC
jgi:hypothetical protein